MIVGRLVIALVLVAARAGAHDRTTSTSSWDIRGRGALVTVGLAALDVSRFPWATGADRDAALGAYLARHLELVASETPCAVTAEPRALAAPPGRVLYEWRLDCPPGGTLAVRSEVLLEVAPGHLHFARVRRDGAAPVERVLSESERSWVLDAGSGAPASASVASYVKLGVEHILGGADHVAFLVALLLLGGGLADVARLVTGFTVGHSLTLGLAVLGWVQPDRAAVEALIGLSIALVATENVWLAGERTGCPRPRSPAWRSSCSATSGCFAACRAPARFAGGSPSCLVWCTASGSPPSWWRRGLWQNASCRRSSASTPASSSASSGSSRSSGR
ncbi:MAG: HupE/UreJ family protein [Deltaproteobacteria bacterium]|nr:MAG: HupE/UreJ family protein [Deltaproteobacteria bacterium]